jgi:hypothetical protein
MPNLSAPASEHEIRAYIDVIDHEAVVGWAAVPGRPDTKLLLEVFADGALVGRIVANAYRRDLAAAGINHGFHGFRFPLSAPPIRAAISVKVAGTSVFAQLLVIAHAS